MLWVLVALALCARGQAQHFTSTVLCHHYTAAILANHFRGEEKDHILVDAIAFVLQRTFKAVTPKPMLSPGCLISLMDTFFVTNMLKIDIKIS